MAQPLQRTLPESTNPETLDFGGQREAELVPVGEEEMPPHDPRTGELRDSPTEEPETDREVWERLRRADEAAKAQRAAAPVQATPPVQAPPQPQPGIDFSVADITDQVLARMRSMSEDARTTPKQLMDFTTEMSKRCPKERQVEVGRLYNELAKAIKGRKS